MTLHLTVAQFRPTKGDFDATFAAFIETLGEAVGGEPAPDLVLFPETALTGYFLEGGVREVAISATDLFGRMAEAYGRVSERPVEVAVGFYELDAGHVYNAALYARLGPDPRIVHLHRKAFLPTYGVFQEERFVESGRGIRAFDADVGRVALLICEDAFHSISATLAALDGAEIILVPSASPARGAEPGPGVPGNVARWDLLGSGIAAEHGVFVAVSQLVGFEGGKGFAGGSAVYSPRGERLAVGPLWEPALVRARLERDDIARARAEEPLFADLERTWTRLLVNSPGSGVARPRAGESREGAGS